MRVPGFSFSFILLACLLAPCRAATPARLPLTFEAIESLGPDSQSIMSLLLFDPGAKRILQRYTATGKHGGLNHGSVYSLYQQPDHGPLWIGTAQGLNRLHHPAGKLASIRFEIASANFVNAIAPGRGGMLWLGTGASLMRYDPASGSMRRYVHDEDQPHSRTINEASTVLEDSRGRVWVGEFFGGAGLDMMSGDDGRFQHFRHDPQRANSISSDKITCLYEDRYGTVWVGTARGLNRMGRERTASPPSSATQGPAIRCRC